MKRCDITKPIGLDMLCAEVESTCSKAHIFKRCGLRPQHLIVPLDPGCGRTTFMEYMTDQYKKAGVLEFTSGLDDYIEVTFDGTLPQLKRVFAAIDSAAVYTNEYCNIIGMDISGIAAHLGETQLAEFMKNCKRVCDHACVVFFVHAVPNRNEEKLLEKLCETVGSVKRLTVEPYTKDDMCALIINAGILTTELGGSTTYTLVCLQTPKSSETTNPAVSAAEAPQQLPAVVIPPPVSDVPKEVTEPAPEPASADITEVEPAVPEEHASIPSMHLALFLGGAALSIGGLIVMALLKRRREYYDDEDDE